MRIASLLLVLLLSSVAAAQGGSLDSDSGQLLTPPQQYGREMIVPDRVTWNVKQFVRLNGGGTGSVISIDNKPYIVSCAHDRDGYVQLGQRVSTQSNRGSHADAVVVAVDTERDCSLMALQCDYEAPTLTVASQTPKPGDRVRAAGFPMGQQLRDRYTVVLAASDEQIHIRAAAIPGDSGGPILNDNGELVGVLFGGNIIEVDPQTRRPIGRTQGSLCVGLGAIRRLIASVEGRPATVEPANWGNCQNGSCRPPGYSQRPPQYRPPTMRPPQPQTPPVKPPTQPPTTPPVAQQPPGGTAPPWPPTQPPATTPPAVPPPKPDEPDKVINAVKPQLASINENLNALSVKIENKETDLSPVVNAISINTAAVSALSQKIDGMADKIPATTLPPAPTAPAARQKIYLRVVPKK